MPRIPDTSAQELQSSVRNICKGEGVELVLVLVGKNIDDDTASTMRPPVRYRETVASRKVHRRRGLLAAQDLPERCGAVCDDRVSELVFWPASETIDQVALGQERGGQISVRTGGNGEKERGTD